MPTPRNIDLDAALRDAEEQYTRANPRSLAQHRQAAETMPGGNTRTVLHYAPFPLTMARGEGARLWDLDGHEYVDFLSEFTAGVYGHSHPKIRAAVEQALDAGINLGAHNEIEARFAAVVTERFPSLELVRFTNSGTEANLMALVAACAVTGRKKVMVFDGGYHGGVFLFRGGAAPINAPFDFVIARYNDIEGTRALAEQHGAELAAIILEPMLGGGGCIPATREFLLALQDMAAKTGALFILDEVMTSRLAPGGLQEMHGLRPDLTTLGKYVGGGMSFGAFGGRREIMQRFDPTREGSFQHAGTFNNNALTMRAGLVGLTEIYTPERAVELNAFGDALRERLNAVARRHGLAMQFTGVGSMLGVHMTAAPIRSVDDAAKGDAKLRDLLFFDLLRRGIWIARRGFLALSVMLTEVDGDTLVAAVEEFAETRAPLFEAGR
jgi:glutamate-1-semialdehyde 2,1-aminomutase